MSDPLPFDPSEPRPLIREVERELPSSEEAEDHVVACCLVDGDDGATIRKASESGLTPNSFYFPRASLLFDTLAQMLNQGRPITTEVVAAELGPRFSEIGWPYLMQITAKVPTTAHAAYFIEKVRECELRRRAIRDARRTIEDAHATGGLDEFLQTTQERTTSLLASSLSAAAKSAQATADLDSRRVRVSKAPKEPQTRLFLAQKPIATPGNLTTVTSKAKTGKTTTLSAAAAAIVAAASDRHNQDTFKFSAPHNAGQAVIVIDTEQSQYDSWLCYERSLKRAGQTDDPKWLHHYSLVGYTPEQVKAAVVLALKQGKATHGGVFILILDGVADLVASVNDEVECNALVVWLRALSVDYDCPIICVIHSNEGAQAGDDGRGHLGKQLIRKAESNLVLKKTDEITTITSEKQRKAPITEKDGVSFQWSDEAQMHVSCKPPGENKRGPKKSKFLEDYISVFANSDATAMTFPVLLRKADAKYPISRDTFWKMVAEGAETGEIQVSRANPNEPRYWVKAV